jgi:hypothetical protein
MVVGASCTFMTSIAARFSIKTPDSLAPAAAIASGYSVHKIYAVP